MQEVCAIVLAAGESKRMGSPKMLLAYNGTTVLGKVIENVLAAGITEPLVISGAERDDIIKAAMKYPVKHCYNDKYRSGMLSSVQCGLTSLADECRAVLVMPGDQPMIGESEINKVIKAWRRSGRGIVMPSFNGKRGHPLLVDMKYRPEILALPEEEGLRRLAERHPDDVLEAETDDPSVLRDIDTKEDYLNELNIIKRDGKDNCRHLGGAHCSGGGEPAIIAVGAAVGNAIFDAVGARLFRVPFTPERVLQAVESQKLKV